VSLGLPRFLLPGGRHFRTSVGNLPSSILWTCPYLSLALPLHISEVVYSTVRINYTSYNTDDRENFMRYVGMKCLREGRMVL
jgi:hypothetical protein